MKVAVVGGGVIGLACAWYLQEGGAEVVVLERGDIRELEGREVRGRVLFTPGHPTEIKAADPRSDLAVLQIKERFSPADFVPMPLGDAKALKKGHIVFSLGNRTQRTHLVRSSRPSAEQRRWMRLVREALDTLTLPDAVMGVTLRVESVTGNGGAQGDLFDRGFASAPAVEDAVIQLTDDQGDVVVMPEPFAIRVSVKFVAAVPVFITLTVVT